MSDTTIYYALAAAYVVGFLLVASRWPRVALMLIFAGAPFQNDLSTGGPFKFSIAEINLVLTLVVFGAQVVTRGRQVTLGPLGIPVVLYLAVCAASAALSWRGGVAVTSLLQIVIYTVLAVAVFSSFGSDPRDWFPCLYGLIAVGVFLALTVLTLGSNYVLGLHKNGAGGSLACAAVVAAELWFATKDVKRRRLLAAALAVIVPGLVFTLSRGAWIGAVTGLVVIASLRRQFMFLLQAACVLVPVGLVCWFMLPAESQSYAGDFAPSSHNIEARFESIEIARKYFERDPFIGVGVGLRKEFDATNVVWTTLAETGVVGLGAFGLIYVAFGRMLWQTQKQVPRTHPSYSFLAIGGALMTVKFMHGLVDHYWSRGELMLAWAGAGMVVGVYVKLRAPAVAAAVARREESRWAPTVELNPAENPSGAAPRPNRIRATGVQPITRAVPAEPALAALQSRRPA